MCCCETPQARQARQQRLQAKYERKLKRYGIPTPSAGSTGSTGSSTVTVPANPPDAGTAPPAYSSIEDSTGPRDLPPSLPKRAPTLAAEIPKLPVLHVKVPKVPILNDPYQNPSLYNGGPQGIHESCQRGEHDGKRVFGVGGLIGGVLMFPFGLFWTKCDSRLICKNCGLVMLPQHMAYSDVEKAQPHHSVHPVQSFQPFHSERGVPPNIAKSTGAAKSTAMVKAN